MIARFDDDFGVFLVDHLGKAEGDTVQLADVPIGRISPCGDDLCTTTIHTQVDGKHYAASFDLTAAMVAVALRNHPQQRMAISSLGRRQAIDLSPPIMVNLIARIGAVARSRLQVFRPLEVIHLTVIEQRGNSS